jgi:protein-disulfide isomerase
MLLKTIKFILFAFGLAFSLSANASVLDSLFHKSNDPVAGNPKGNLTIVEFFDYQCSHCVNMASTIQSIIKQNPNVRIVFKEYPIRGPMSEVASRAALAANMQGKYYAFNHALLTTNMDLSEKNILGIAKANGLNVDKLKKDMNSKTVKDALQANFALAKELGIAGTPAFFIGKTDAKNTEEVNFVLGEMSQSDIQKALQKSSS